MAIFTNQFYQDTTYSCTQLSGIFICHFSFTLNTFFMKKIIISSTLILLFIYGCQDEACQFNNDSNKKTSNGKMNHLEWIIGSWSNISPKGQLYENWVKTNDSVYTGNSFMVVKNDTVFSEMISLENRNGQIFYIPTVKNENHVLYFQKQLRCFGLL